MSVHRRLMQAIVVASCEILLLGGCGGSGTAYTTVTHSIGATVSGLSGTGLVLQLNGGNDLSVMANGATTFPTPIDSGATYSITVRAQPTQPVQTCSITSGSGTIGNADVSGIVVTCVTAVVTVYSFTGNGPDDAHPNGSLVQGRDGNLYGTIGDDGKLFATTSQAIFRVTLSGEETLLFSGSVFANCPVYSNLCATYSNSGLILGSDGNFYGIDAGVQGSNTSGPVYRITSTGAVSVIAAFDQPDGGDSPSLGGIIQGRDGLLYGTTPFYGVFSVPPTGDQPVGLAFPPNIFGVTAALVQAPDGTLYGTSAHGGAYGEGTVFEAAPTGVDPPARAPPNAIYSFGATPADAVTPGFSLVVGNDGNLYGTTTVGGSPSATCPNGCGTVFKVTPSGTETVLHSFGTTASDGQTPSGALVLGADGNFYGTTSAGGSSNSNCKATNGCGTLYRITPSGVATVLYSFGTNAGDGTAPLGALLQASDGNFYGATAHGGASGGGTIFRMNTANN